MTVARIRADRGVCVGAGMCAMVAPEHFAQDEADGTVIVEVETVSTEALSLIEEAVLLCPSGALSLNKGSDGVD